MMPSCTSGDKAGRARWRERRARDDEGLKHTIGKPG
jgi:hypothetical protein